jgi:hypothetical protein
MDNQKVLKFLEYFSVITVGDNKIPNFAWKEQQTKKLTQKKLNENLSYQGGYKWTDKDNITHERKATTGFGIVTGYEDLEVIDIDLKVFSTAQEQRDFWNEFYQYLDDNILDFKDKFCITKTKNAGYHILYKTKRVEGNLKLAKLKGHKEALIETRGVGGYVFAYPDNIISNKTYFDIDYISDQDREILFSFARMYNYVEEIVLEPKKEKTEYKTGDITPWADFNDKNNILDIVGNDFSQVANHNKKIVIKRHGATSPHSGYIFKDSGCMFLFSTGTIYPHEKLITPFIAYTYKNFNGDFQASASQIYKDGYGSRIEKKQTEKLQKIKDVEKYEIKNIDFPIDIFPKPIQSYILECASTLNSNIDYMGCSLMWLISVCVGNSFNIKIKNGWNENGVLWLSLVGSAGIGKTPSINNIIHPLQKINQKEIKKYYKKLEEYENYMKLSASQKKAVIEIFKPIKTQFIANDITLEALVDLHQESDNAVGVFKDELAGWLKDMNKYRAGSDLEFWLSCWSGKSVNLNRMTRKGSYVDKPFIPVLGGIQPTILNFFYTEENKDNGFMDRMLLSYPDAIVEAYNENELDYDTYSWYQDHIIGFHQTMKKIIVRDNEDNIKPHEVVFSIDAKKEWVRIFNEITNIQNSDNENEYLKSMYPKQKSYIPRFALLIHLFNDYLDNKGAHEISKDSILKAEKLSKYFVETAKKVKINQVEVRNIKTTIKPGKTNAEKLKLIFDENPDFNRSKTAELLGISVRQVFNLIKKFEEK